MERTIVELEQENEDLKKRINLLERAREHGAEAFKIILIDEIEKKLNNSYFDDENTEIISYLLQIVKKQDKQISMMAEEGNKFAFEVGKVAGEQSKRIKELEEALKFYGDGQKYWVKAVNFDVNSEILKDDGETARKALENN